MEILVYSVLFITGTFLSFLLLQVLLNKNEVVRERLNVVRMTSNTFDEDEDELREPFIDRVIKPAYQKLIQAIGNAAPAEIKKRYEDLIISSSTSTTMTFNSLIAIQIMLGIVLGSITYLMFTMTGGKANLLLVFVTGIIGFILPYSSLNTKSLKRKEGIQKALPDLLDLLYVSVEAGLAFDMAIKRATEKMHGPLSEEFKKTMDEISKGRSREEALKGMVRRTQVDDLASFVTSVIQAEQLGSNIANVLRVQSVSMRGVRRQRAREKAAKIPVKMLFPLIFFMFPSLFVIILGPAAINIIDMLGGML
jgi:tight adherence protein C